MTHTFAFHSLLCYTGSIPKAKEAFLQEKRRDGSLRYIKTKGVRFILFPATPAIHLMVNRTISEVRKLCFAKRKGYAMKKSKMSPKKPVYHSDPSVPISVRVAFNSLYGIEKR